MKTRLLIIIGVISIITVLGITQLEQEEETGNYQYTIQGDKDGTGIGKTDLILTRTNLDNPSNIHTVDLTKDLHYSKITGFLDWEIHSVENYVFVSWRTNDYSWSDVFLAVSDDYGKTFKVKNVTQTKGYIDRHKIDYSENSIYVVYRDEFRTEENVHLNHIYFTKSDNYGESFGQHKLLNTFDKSGYEFDLESFEENVFVVWRQDTDSHEENNVWFASSTDRAEWFEREAKMIGAHVDADSFNGILHLTWVSVDDDDQVWYAYSEDLGQTLHSRIIFDADWELSPYAERPRPKLSVDDDIVVEFEMNNKKGEKTHYTIPIIDENEREVDWSEITLMKPNSARLFYYPNPEKTENRDVFQLFSLIRLPEHLGGNADDISAFRAYSAVTLTVDHCLVKYWPDNGRQRLEDPCWGSMYRVIDGLMITNPDLVMNTSPVALPSLELSMDEYGTLYVEPPNFTREENGVIGTGRFISPQEIDRGSQTMIDEYEKSHPHHPKIPQRFAGNYLAELHAYDNDVEVRYADLASLSSPYISMRIDNVSAAQQQYFLNLASSNSEFWQLDDVVFKITGPALNPNTTLPERFQEYKIEFILDGFMFEIIGNDVELIKNAIISNYFPDNTYDDMFLISSTMEK